MNGDTISNILILLRRTYVFPADWYGLHLPSITSDTPGCTYQFKIKYPMSEGWERMREPSRNVVAVLFVDLHPSRHPFASPLCGSWHDMYISNTVCCKFWAELGHAALTASPQVSTWQSEVNVAGWFHLTAWERTVTFCFRATRSNHREWRPQVFQSTQSVLSSDLYVAV